METYATGDLRLQGYLTGHVFDLIQDLDGSCWGRVRLSAK